MRRFICFAAILALLSAAAALAWDIPQTLLFDDEALLFFGEVVSHEANQDMSDVYDITLLPTQKIKGGVDVGAELTCKNCCLMDLDGFTLADGEIYLFAKCDENNTYVFRTTNTDTKTLKIEGMDARDLEQYLHEGAYEQKEAERLARISEAALSQEPVSERMPAPTPAPSAPPTPADISETDAVAYWPYGLAGAVVIFGVILYLRKRMKT